LIAETYCLNWLARVRRKGRGVAGRGGNRGGAGPAKQRRRRKEGGGEEAHQWDPVVSERKRKEKEGGGVGWHGEGLVGRRARKEGRVCFVFFHFLFQTLFKSIF
jgi:hypothetical protein